MKRDLDIEFDAKKRIKKAAENGQSLTLTADECQCLTRGYERDRDEHERLLRSLPDDD